ncbi:MAG: NFYB/HAP3 family transcription factor subunit [Candidatus Aenigmarchaeota archaeon]|nr:NFYB/HAP3 family transcription factor subunit [Candidatus Aenigmarchaeota archaeon]
MTKDKKNLPLAPLERLLRKLGAKRVSKGAVKEFSNRLTDYVGKLSAEAATLARHAGRKTIIDEDVKMARRKITS